MIGALKQMEAGRRAEDVAREVGVSKHTLYAWKAKYGGMDVSQAQEAKQLRDENTRLRKLGGKLVDPQTLAKEDLFSQPVFERSAAASCSSAGRRHESKVDPCGRACGQPSFLARRRNHAAPQKAE
jgi:putative transposase